MRERGVGWAVLSSVRPSVRHATFRILGIQNVPSTPSHSNVREANMQKVTFHLAGLFSFEIEEI